MVNVYLLAILCESSEILQKFLTAKIVAVTTCLVIPLAIIVMLLLSFTKVMKRKRKSQISNFQDTLLNSFVLILCFFAVPMMVTISLGTSDLKNQNFHCWDEGNYKNVELLQQAEKEDAKANQEESKKIAIRKQEEEERQAELARIKAEEEAKKALIESYKKEIVRHANVYVGYSRAQMGAYINVNMHWCANFVSYVVQNTNIPELNKIFKGIETGSVPTFIRKAQQRGWFYYAEYYADCKKNSSCKDYKSINEIGGPQEGDIVFFDGHIGIVVGVSKDRITYVHGNIPQDETNGVYKWKIDKYHREVVGFARWHE